MTQMCVDASSQTHFGFLTFVSVFATSDRPETCLFIIIHVTSLLSACAG